MNYRLSALTMQEVTLNRDLASRAQALGLDNPGDWESHVEAYFADLRDGLTPLNVPPESEAERKEKFKLKWQIVLNLVEKVTIGRNRKLKVSIRLDLLKFLCGEFGEIKNNGTCAVPQPLDVHLIQTQFPF